MDTEVDTDVDTDVDTEVDTDVDMDVDEGEEDEGEEDDNSVWMNGEQLITNRYSVRMFRQEAEDPPWTNMEELLTNRYSVRMFRQDPEETPMGVTSGRSLGVPMFPPVEVGEDSVMGEEVGGVKKRKREPEELPSNTRVKVVGSEGVRAPRPGLVCGGQTAEASDGGVPGPQIVDGGDVAVSGGPGTSVPAVSPAIFQTAAEEGLSEPGLGVVGERGLEAGENTRSEAGVGKHPGASSSKSPPTSRGNRGQKGGRVGVEGGRIEKPSRGGAGGRRIDAIRGCVRLAGEWGARAVVGGANLLAGVGFSVSLFPLKIISILTLQHRHSWVECP